MTATPYERFFERVHLALLIESDESGDKFYKLGALLNRHQISLKAYMVDQLRVDCAENLFCDIRSEGKHRKDWEIKILPAGKKFAQQFREFSIDEIEKAFDYALTISQRIELSSNISEALKKIDDLNLTQEKKSQARAFLIAAQQLLEAPEPPFSVVHFLLKRVDTIIGVSGFLVGVAGLFGT